MSRRASPRSMGLYDTAAQSRHLSPPAESRTGASGSAFPAAGTLPGRSLAPAPNSPPSLHFSPAGRRVATMMHSAEAASPACSSLGHREKLLANIFRAPAGTARVPTVQAQSGRAVNETPPGFGAPHFLIFVLGRTAGQRQWNSCDISVCGVNHLEQRADQPRHGIRRVHKKTFPLDFADRSSPAEQGLAAELRACFTALSSNAYLPAWAVVLDRGQLFGRH